MPDTYQKQDFFPDEENDDLFFADDEVDQGLTEENWKILIVDDDPEVHKVTQLALKNFIFEGKSLKFINAYSGEEAKQLIALHPDIAMILLDVVMEKDDAGLEVVNYIRSFLKNEFVQIILRTGQPGKCPETAIILNYEINDYKTKTELTKPKLLTVVVTALRTFNEIKKLDDSKAKLEKVAQEKNQLYQQAKNYSQVLEARVEERTRELKAKEARLREAQKLAQLGSFECDSSLQKLTCSDELFRIFGLDPTLVEPSHETVHNLIHPNDREFWAQSLAQTIASGQDNEAEFRIVRPDGVLRYVFVKQQAIKDAQGKVIKLFGTVQDISDRKETEAALHKALEAAKVANRSKSEFIANMSHELRNPLNGILGYAQILRRDKTIIPNSKQWDGINIIYQCGSHLLTLINDLLDIAKIEARTMELYPTEFHLPNFLFNVQQIFRLRAEQKQLTFIYEPSPQLPIAVRADEKRLRQVLINLLSNAIKFTYTGRVTFSVEILQARTTVNESKNIRDRFAFCNNELDSTAILPNPPSTAKIRFQIEDTGVGMAPEQLSKIFLPFEQVGDSSSKEEGIGLGLAITKNIVSLMGGEIFVESNLGEGSLFRIDVELPLVSVELDADLTKSPATIIGFEGKTRKILVVDDAFANRSVITNMLEPIGFEVSEAANGEEGIEKATQLKPDLIITNLMMPVMNGLEMTKRLRRLPECQNTLVIASSASVFEIDRRKSREAGCNDFLPKPIQSEELLEKIQSCLGVVWITESTNNPIPNPEKTEPLIAPPPSELVTLYQAAQIGDIEGVEVEATRLRQLAPQYVTFANKLLQLAQEFEEQKILKLVEQYISES
jgi:PAS domain S-box-containing protein